MDSHVHPPHTERHTCPRVDVHVRDTRTRTHRRADRLVWRHTPGTSPDGKTTSLGPTRHTSIPSPSTEEDRLHHPCLSTHLPPCPIHTVHVSTGSHPLRPVRRNGSKLSTLLGFDLGPETPRDAPRERQGRPTTGPTVDTKTVEIRQSKSTTEFHQDSLMVGGMSHNESPVPVLRVTCRTQEGQSSSSIVPTTSYDPDYQETDDTLDPGRTGRDLESPLTFLIYSSVYVSRSIWSSTPLHYICLLPDRVSTVVLC